MPACSRAFTRDISTNVLYCWGATCWLVCFGAPLGSLLLTPGLRAQLRIAFYLLAIAQFVGFAVIKVKAKPTAWIIFASVTVAVFGGLALHWKFGQRKLVRQGVVAEKLDASVFRKRLLK